MGTTRHDDNQQLNGTVTLAGAVTQSGLLTSSGGLQLSPGTLAAAGSDQSGAAPIVSTFTTVTGADDTKGVLLPDAATATGIYVVHNSAAANTLEVYPFTDGIINGGSADAAVTLAAKETAIFFWTAADTWVGIAGVTF